MLDKLEIFNSGNDVEKYEQLIIMRDELLSDGDSYEVEFQKKFGEEILDIFKVEVECIKLKKIITLIQMKINKGEKIDPEELNASIFVEMQFYNRQIKEKLEHLNGCKECGNISGYEANEIKKIYRNVVKIIHPDISDITEKDPEIKNLWIKIYKCYRTNDLKGIREANVLLKKKLEEAGIKNSLAIDTDDLNKKIEELESEIMDIQDSVPYTYGEWIFDDEKVKAKHDENAAELKKYQEYEEELKKVIAELKGNR